MRHRTTIKGLEALCDDLNRTTGSPMTPYTRKDGKLTANVGNYHIDQAYRGCNLVRMVSEGGGVTCPLGLGRMTKSELADRIRAYIAGIRENDLGA